MAVSPSNAPVVWILGKHVSVNFILHGLILRLFTYYFIAVYKFTIYEENIMHLEVTFTEAVHLYAVPTK